MLIVVGLLGIGYGGFSYTPETHNADLGPIHVYLAEKERVDIPIWAGVGALVAGTLLLVVGRKVL